MSSELQSVTHALRVLRTLEKRSPRGVSELAAQLQISSSTAHRLLRTLVTEGMVVQDAPTKKYALSRGVRLTAPSVLLTHCLEIAQEPMRRLRDATSETLHIAVIDGVTVRFVAVVAVVESERLMKVTSRVGREALAHTTAAGKLLLGYRTDEDIERMYRSRYLERPTSNSVTRFDDFLREIRAARHDRFARNLSESEVGMYTIAVPVESQPGHAICALTVAGPVDRIGASGTGALSSRERDILDSLRASAAGITAELNA